MIGKPQTVHGVDGRVWTVDTRREWGLPTGEDGFEHDVTSTQGAVVIMASLFLFWLVLIVWKPAGVIIPWFFWVIGLIVFGYFPTRWLMKRPVIISVETAGSYDMSAERWVGQLRGLQRLREERKIIVRRLRTQGTPGHADSPLQPIELPTKVEHRPTVSLAKSQGQGQYTDLEPPTIPDLKIIKEDE